MDEEKMITTKDHDLLVRLDEKMDQIGKVLEALIKTLDDRGKAIDELKTYNLLHKQETDTMWKKYDSLEDRVSEIESRVKIDEAVIDVVKDASITLWIQKHPKLTTSLIIIGLIILNLHDVIVPYLFSLFGYKTP